MFFYRLPEYERLIVFGISGKFAGLMGPGFVFVPPGQKAVGRIDLREKVKDIPDQECITKDNVPVSINPIVFYKYVEPKKAILEIAGAEKGIFSLARTTLRAVVGDMELSDVIAKREEVAIQLRQRLAAATERWGIEVTTVEIADLRLQPEVEQAMSRRKADIEIAEAERSWTILKAQAKKEAARAEAEARIIRADAEKQATISQAEAEKQTLILQAEGRRAQYQLLTELGAGADIVLQFESIAATKSFGASNNAKRVIIPAEMKGLNSSELGGLAQLHWAEAVVPEENGT